MMIGDRLRALREEKKFTQGDIEKRTGLLRAHISSIENGRTVPTVETLEKLARALEVPMYQLFYDGEKSLKLPIVPERKAGADIVWGSKGKDARLLAQFCRLFSRMDKGDVGTVLFVAQKMARRKAV
jgi:transcriptional regulator with XRE-family HTH domain